jgi:hypothetical protein
MKDHEAVMTFDFGELDKAHQKNRLIMEFGILLAPLRELAARETPPRQVDYIRALAPFETGPAVWWNHAHLFAQGMGKIEENLVHLFGNSLMSIRFTVGHPVADLDGLQKSLRACIEDLEQRFLKLVDLIPLDWELSLSEGQTPFTFYMHVLDAVSMARNRLHYFDRYLKPEFFDLYLRNVDRDLEIKLVTTAGKGNYGVQGVLAISELARQEFSNYQLIQVAPADMHDRNLRIDDQVFTLGTSAADAGKQPTHFGPVDASGHTVLDGLLAKGTVIHQS